MSRVCFYTFMKDIEREDVFKFTYNWAHKSLLRDRGLGKLTGAGGPLVNNLY